MRTSLDELNTDIKNELRDYGQYLTMRGAKPGVQRFGSPEILTAVISIIVWSLTQYLKSFLGELGALKAKSISSKQDLSSKEIENRLANIENCLQELKNEVPHTEPKLYQTIIEVQNLITPMDFKVFISEDELAIELQRMGLTKRAARKLSTRLSQKWTVGINRLILERER